MTPKSFLDLYEDYHGSLSAEERETVLACPLLRDLLSFPEPVLRIALHKQTELCGVVEEGHRLQRAMEEVAQQGSGVSVPIEVLRLWEEAHGRLGDEWLESFLTHPLQPMLSSFPESVLRAAFSNEHKLHLAVRVAEKTNAERRGTGRFGRQKNVRIERSSREDEAASIRQEDIPVVRENNDSFDSRSEPKRTPPRPSESGRRGSGHGSGSGGFYRMPRSRKPEKAAGTCSACGVRYGFDGACGCS